MSGIFPKRDSTTIVVTRETRDRLAALGSKDETFESIIQKLLDKENCKK